MSKQDWYLIGGAVLLFFLMRNNSAQAAPPSGAGSGSGSPVGSPGPVMRVVPPPTAPVMKLTPPPIVRQILAPIRRNPLSGGLPPVSGRGGYHGVIGRY